MNELESDFQQTGEKFIAAIEQFSQQDLNKISTQGSWSAGQVADHIRQSVEGALDAAVNAGEHTDRRRDEKAEEIRNIFLDFSIKMESPEFILPTNDPVDKEEMIASLKKTWAALTERVNANNLSDLYADFEFPGSGKLTAYEWLLFAMFHTQRHTEQLKNIAAALKG